MFRKLLFTREVVITRVKLQVVTLRRNPRSARESTNSIWLVRSYSYVGLLCIGGPEPMVYLGVCRLVRGRISLRVPAGRLAVRIGRSRLVLCGGATLVAGKKVERLRVITGNFREGPADGTLAQPRPLLGLLTAKDRNSVVRSGIYRHCAGARLGRLRRFRLDSI